MEILSKEFFSNYLFNPLSDDLLKKEKIHACVASLGLSVFSIGIIPLVSYLSYNRKYSILDSKENKSENFVFIKNRAECGSRSAQCLLGIMLSEGKGILQNQTEAIIWWQKSAEQGYATAQFHLGQAYLEGNGVNKNRTIALSWFLKASKQDVPGAHAMLGSMYFSGNDVAQNDTMARYHFEKFIVLSDKLPQFFYALACCFKPWQTETLSDAAYKLGILYGEGRGGTKDIKQASYYYAKSAHPEALYKLGVIYEKGEGVEKDENTAFHYFSLSALANNGDAQFKMAKAYFVKENENALKLFPIEMKMNSLTAAMRISFISAYYSVSEHEARAIYMLEEAQKNGNTQAGDFLKLFTLKN